MEAGLSASFSVAFRKEDISEFIQRRVVVFFSRPLSKNLSPNGDVGFVESVEYFSVRYVRLVFSNLRREEQLNWAGSSGPIRADDTRFLYWFPVDVWSVIWLLNVKNNNSP